MGLTVLLGMRLRLGVGIECPLVGLWCRSDVLDRHRIAFHWQEFDAVA